MFLPDNHLIKRLYYFIVVLIIPFLGNAYKLVFLAEVATLLEHKEESCYTQIHSLNEAVLFLTNYIIAI